MMFSELATPATTKTETSTAPIGNDTTQSRPGIAVRTSTASSSSAASSADNAVAARRRRGLTRLVRSSISPAASAGSPQASSVNAGTPMSASRHHSTIAPASAPQTMPTAPMRGTGCT